MQWTSLFAKTRRKSDRETKTRTNQSERPAPMELSQDDKDNRALSEDLLIRGGFIRQNAAGLYSLLPLGLRVLKRIEGIIRNEMDAAGGQEALFPLLISRENFDECGRWDRYGDELFRLKDRREREFCLGPTHEEIVGDVVRGILSSYRQLPFMLYQIHTKFRDEARPRGALLRCREFRMKDAYSFCDSEDTLRKDFEKMKVVYREIFRKLRLRSHEIEADAGTIGGSHSIEFVVLANAGEDFIKAESQERVPAAYKTPQQAKAYNFPATQTRCQFFAHLQYDGPVYAFDQFIKPVFFATKENPSTISAVVCVRATDSVSLEALEDFIGSSLLVLEDETKICEQLSLRDGECSECLSPEGIRKRLPLCTTFVIDETLASIANLLCGGDDPGIWQTGISYKRDFDEPWVLRDIAALPSQSDQKGIEVGHIFKLGTSYSSQMKINFKEGVDEDKPVWMGCYGIGTGRLLSVIVEKNNDKDGIIWPLSVAPFDIIITTLDNDTHSSVYEYAKCLYHKIKNETQFDVLFDERNERPGVKFNDADLIGIPIQVRVGRHFKESKKVEIRTRDTGEQNIVHIDTIIENIQYAYACCEKRNIVLK